MMQNGKFVVPPSLTDVFDAHRDDVGSKLRVCMPGAIVSYDATKRTATISLGETQVLPNGTVIAVNAPLLDIPVLTLQGGGIHLGVPIGPGDECLVVFADFNIDAWHTAGGQQTPPDKTQHDINDGFAIVGPNSLANALVTALTATEGGISGTLAKVAIDKNTEMITLAKGGTTLALILTNLLTALTALNTAIAADANVQASTRTAATAANTAIAAVQVLINELLY
jgi:hypothetical protein